MVEGDNGDGRFALSSGRSRQLLTLALEKPKNRKTTKPAVES
jgi:hypothetical protein